jgi:hypothetical protein
VKIVLFFAANYNEQYIFHKVLRSYHNKNYFFDLQKTVKPWWNGVLSDLKRALNDYKNEVGIM